MQSGGSRVAAVHELVSCFQAMAVAALLAKKIHSSD